MFYHQCSAGYVHCHGSLLEVLCALVWTSFRDAMYPGLDTDTATDTLSEANKLPCENVTLSNKNLIVDVTNTPVI